MIHTPDENSITDPIALYEWQCLVGKSGFMPRSTHTRHCLHHGIARFRVTTIRVKGLFHAPEIETFTTAQFIDEGGYYLDPKVISEEQWAAQECPPHIQREDESE